MNLKKLILIIISSFAISQDNIGEGLSGQELIDFLLDNSSKKKKYYFLECNTHPGLTDISLAPEQANFVGISYSELITMILKSSNA